MLLREIVVINSWGRLFVRLQVTFGNFQFPYQLLQLSADCSIDVFSLLNQIDGMSLERNTNKSHLSKQIKNHSEREFNKLKQKLEFISLSTDSTPPAPFR